MPNNTTSAYEGLVSTSLDALKGTFPTSIVFIFVGLFATTTNILEIITIATNKNLRTRCYFLIANLSAASVFNGASYVALGIKRIVRTSMLIPEVNTKAACAGEMFTCSFGQTAIIFLPLATAVDRLCAATKPSGYKSMSYHFSTVTVSLAWSAALLDSCFTFFGNDQSKLVANCNLVSATELLYVVQSSVELAISCSVTLCYLSLVLVLRYKMKKARSTSETVAASKMKKQVKVVKTLGVESAVHLLTQVGTRVGLAILTPMSADVRFQYAPYIRLFIIVGSGLNLFVFLVVNAEFKMAFKRTFYRATSSQVVPITSTTWVELKSRKFMG